MPLAHRRMRALSFRPVVTILCRRWHGKTGGFALFSIKICGITTVRDAQIAASAGADAIGLNFYRSSPRYVPAALAFSIARAIPGNVAKVGVFVNTPAKDVSRIASDVGLDQVQLHGDEPPEDLIQLSRLPVIRAFRVRDGDVGPVVRYLACCQQLRCLPAAILLDAFQEGQFGGTGKTIRWESLVGNTDFLGEIPLILAGGLTPDNVAAAIETIAPKAVDTASGVEKQPGEKDETLVRRFVTAARTALACRGM